MNIGLCGKFSDFFKCSKKITDISYEEITNIISRESLLKSRELKSEQGVYLFFENSELAYVGSAGKYRSLIGESTQGIRERILNASAPYSIWDNTIFYQIRERKDDVTISIRAGYLNFDKLKIGIFYTRKSKIIPSALEHLLIQTYVNEHNNLPKINNEL